MEASDIDKTCVNTIRVLGAELPQNANSGHPGAPMGMAPMAHALWTEFMKVSPPGKNWPNRDRFILSNGHGCALLYTLLHLTGFLELEDLKQFRQVGSRTPGHPESPLTPGVEATTGPLGQGISNAVGFAIGEKHLAATYNKPDFPIVDHFTYVFCGDGCLQEGISSEASSLAGHLGLGKLIVLYDDNDITIDGPTTLSWSEDVAARYESYGWHVQTVSDGDFDLDGIKNAIRAAQQETSRPSFIKVKTTIGFGAKKQGTSSVHGSPIGAEDLARVKKEFGFDPALSFHIPDEVKDVYSKVVERGANAEQEWSSLFEKYSEAHPELAKEFKMRIAGELADGWDNLPGYSADDPPDATRKLGIPVINSLAASLPQLIGGSADLNPSTFTYLKDSCDFTKDTPEGRNIRFGVREHGMAAVCNGLAYYGGFIPYCSTFLNFIGYMWGSCILSALSHLRVIYIMTHDSIGLGEDGPTHQPIEKYALCRSTPNMLFIRPCDGNEVTASYIAAVKHTDGPTVISLSRQGFPQQKNTSVEGVMKGAYVIHEPEGTPDLILIGTGSEVHLCTQAAEQLSDHKVRVVSMPCWELYEKQDDDYKKEVFPDGVPVLSVESGVTKGWSRYAHASIGIDSFGLSGPSNQVMEEFGFSTKNVVEKAAAVLDFYSGRAVPSLTDRPSF